MTERTVAENAAEVRGIEVGRDYFRRAVLIACSVERGSRGKCPDGQSGKVSADTFAGMVSAPGFSRQTIVRILDRWEEASSLDPQDYPPAHDLSPADVDTIERPDGWEEWFGRQARSGGPEKEEWNAARYLLEAQEEYNGMVKSINRVIEFSDDCEDVRPGIDEMFEVLKQHVERAINHVRR